jgi:amidase
MGRSAGDLGLGLDVLAGPPEDDAVAWRLDLPPARNGGALAGLRVATWFDDPFVPIAADVRALLDAAAGALGAAGATVAAVEPPVCLEDLAASWERLVLPIMTAGLSDQEFAAFAQIEATPVGEHEILAVRVMRAITARHRDWLVADETRHHHRRRFAELFEHHDVLLAPVMPTAAFAHDTETELAARTLDVDGDTRPYFESIYWAGGIGTLLLPVAVAPIGRTSGGLPVGVQIVAPHLHDRTAVAVAGHVESVLGGFVPPPALAGAASG